MRIAQVAPLYESVPPLLYGGTERVVHTLTEKLVEMGHDVTLFASADSVTSARLFPAAGRALRLDSSVVDSMTHHVLMLEQVRRLASSFDLIHFHTGYLQFSSLRQLTTPTLTTYHGRLDLPELAPLFREFSSAPLVSISQHQRSFLPWANWTATIYHGLPADLYHFDPHGGDYLAFLGRISPEKGIEDAIEIAARSGMKLIVAAKVDKADLEYFRMVVKPLMEANEVEYIGEISDASKGVFLGRARALLFPIRWPEPFGLVMIEAMACGTPIIAYPEGSVPEVLEIGSSGLIVDGVDEAVKAVEEVRYLSRRKIRDCFVAKFLDLHMAAAYECVYQRLAAQPRIRTRNWIKTPASPRLTRRPKTRMPRRSGAGL